MFRRLALPLTAAAVALMAVGLVAQPLVLSSDVRDAAHPRLAAAPDGTVHLMFIGRMAHAGGVFHRAWSDGVWGEQSVIGIASGGGEVYDPALAICPDGTVHAVWSAQGDGLFHCALRDGEWSGVRRLDNELGGAGEFPSVVGRADGGAEVVWQALVDGNFQVAHTSLSATGEASIPRMIGCQSPEGYNVCPQVFLAPTPTILWYEAVDGDLVLRAAEQVPGPTWRRVPVDGLMGIGANRLPILLQSGLGQWAALWHDAAPRQDRVLLGRGGPPTYGVGEIVDANPDFDNVSPSAASIAADRWAVAWRGEGPAGPEIFLAVEEYGGWRQSMMTGGLTAGAAQPAVAGADGLVHVVWTSDSREGGSGLLSHIAVPAP